ncbi:MAG: M56 family metallopeptidase, partial [Planctomycetaceae bacterium]|nr:M56 family metallopeptidase [Planctomycetaceae bacterium]
SEETDAPFAIGAFRPVIVMPRAMTEQLQPDQLTIVIAHELAHIRRRDLFIGWFETLVSIVWWFHPALWWLRKSLRQTREDCCDDLLLAHQLAEPERYCETLIEAARRQSTRLAEPLVLGFVHQEHPATRRIRRLMDGSLFRADRLRYPALIFALLVALVILPGMRPERQPVTKTTLEGNFGWRNLPFQIDAAEEAAIKECRDLAQTYFFTRNDIRDFSLPETREKLEAILEQHPKLFYAQHLLGTWHRVNGNSDEAARLFKEALANAPVVLTQCYKQGNGEPIKGVKVDQIDIECNRVQNRSLDPSLNLKYVALITDSQGQVYLPVYDTVYRTSTQSYPDGYSAAFQNLGWFESKSLNGILPDVMVWKPWSRPRDFTRTAAQTPRLQNATGTDTLKLNSGSNTYAIGSVSRAQADGTFTTADGKGRLKTSKTVLPTITNAIFMDHALIKLSEPETKRFALSQVEVLDSQTKIPLQSFQYGAGFTWSDQSRFHLFSLWEKLPDTVDLVLKVFNYDSTDFRYQVPAAVGSTVQHAGSSIEITYLGAGNHNGWSSNSGFYGEAQSLENTSEIIFNITGNRDQKFSLWVVSKTGRRQNLREDGWFSAQTGNSPVRIMLPLNEIAHFELVPYVEPVTIYFEQIRLPSRAAPLDQQLPTIEFPIDG